MVQEVGKCKVAVVVEWSEATDEMVGTVPLGTVVVEGRRRVESCSSRRRCWSGEMGLKGICEGLDVCSCNGWRLLGCETFG